MKSSLTKTFRKRFERLPLAVQEQAEKAYELWREDPYHNSLQFKRVSQRQPIYSARVSIDYRVLGLLESDNHIYWFWIGAHDEYDELLKRL
jgi:mRNA-degrading endonuclease RelE of RelBE toxin-antitoxin system